MPIFRVYERSFRADVRKSFHDTKIRTRTGTKGIKILYNNIILSISKYKNNYRKKNSYKIL